MKLTVDQVRARVQHIAFVRQDFEAAHGLEDDLWADVLQAIASGAPNARELATEALASQRLDFNRRCA